jgi:hypothetical protein
MPESYWTRVDVDLPLALPTRIVNDQGTVVSRAAPGLHNELGFHPDAGSHYRPPGGLQTMASAGDQPEPYEGQSYYLEILPTSEVEAGKSYPITIKVSNREQMPVRMRLPLVYKNWSRNQAP